MEGLEAGGRWRAPLEPALGDLCKHFQGRPKFARRPTVSAPRGIIGSMPSWRESTNEVAQSDVREASQTPGPGSHERRPS